MNDNRSARKKHPSHNVKLSKSLSWLLRHGLIKEGFTPRPDGFVYLDDVLRHPKFKGTSVEQVKELVRDNDKQRFLLQASDDGRLMIRANQGHSKHVAEKLDDEQMLHRITSASELPLCIHGTYSSKLPRIMQTGLSRMSRAHIHFAQGFPRDTGVISGMRGTCDVIIYLDVEKALSDNIPLYRSENGVILSPGISIGTLDGVIPPLYFAKVVNRSEVQPNVAEVSASSPPQTVITESSAKSTTSAVADAGVSHHTTAAFNLENTSPTTLLSETDFPSLSAAVAAKPQ